MVLKDSSGTLYLSRISGLVPWLSIQLLIAAVIPYCKVQYPNKSHNPLAMFMSV